MPRGRSAHAARDPAFERSSHRDSRMRAGSSSSRRRRIVELASNAPSSIEPGSIECTSIEHESIARTSIACKPTEHTSTRRSS